MDTQLQTTASTHLEALTRAAPRATPVQPDKSAALSETKPQKEKPLDISKPNIAAALERIQKFVEPMASDLQFSVDEESGMRVVKVMDRATKEIIRQIPSSEVLEIAKALDRLQGLFLKQKA